MWSYSLESESCTELNDPGRSGADDLAERRAVDIRVRVVELGVVEQIKELCPKLKLLIFR